MGDLRAALRERQAGPRRHRRRAISFVASVAFLAQEPASAAPQFVTQPSEIFEQFSALKEPRADLPVGALWVQDYGPHGEGAVADNLVTVRSLSGITLSGDLQLRLTLGLAALLNLEPGYSRRISARFSDLTIVRVKDFSKLAGPAGEPRIYEALKAATINITTDRDIGFDVGGALTVKNLPVVARADTGGKKSFTIDGRDLFIAYSVAASVPSQGQAREVEYGAAREINVAMRDYRVRLQAPAPTAASAAGPCPPTTVTLIRRSKGGDEASSAITHDFSTPDGGLLNLPLPAPVADGEGGLLTAIVVKAVRANFERASPTAAASCSGENLRLSLRLEGERLEKLENAKAPGW